MEMALHSEVVSGAESQKPIRTLVRCENEVVMKEKQNARSKWLTVRLSDEEERMLLQLCGRTTARGLSEYARDVLLKEPVTVLYRNASADDFLTQMLGLKKELNAVASNFNQAVHKLNTIAQTSEVKTWVVIHEASRRSLQKKTEEILEKLSEIYNLWSQK